MVHANRHRRHDESIVGMGDTSALLVGRQAVYWSLFNTLAGGASARYRSG
jgi:hypothetical protein